MRTSSRKKRGPKENTVEDYLAQCVALAGGVCLKLNPAWAVGIPDRLVVLQDRVAFVETKRPKGGRLSVTQKWWNKRLTALGCECHTVNTREAVDIFIGG